MVDFVLTFVLKLTKNKLILGPVQPSNTLEMNSSVAVALLRFNS